ncbi:MAG: hypothetical protein LAT83_13520 [Kiritimatiellae bacterium]|nr:hypothetical protein [Kiritimatiellia bacterium]
MTSIPLRAQKPGTVPQTPRSPVVSLAESRPMEDGVPETGLLGHPMLMFDIGGARSVTLRENRPDEAGLHFGLVGAGLNIPLASHFDLGLDLRYLVYMAGSEEVSDLTIDHFSGEALLHFSLASGAWINPFLSAGYHGRRTTWKLYGHEEKASDGGPAYGGGLELRVARHTGIIISGLQKKLEEDSVFQAQGIIQVWFMPNAAGRFGYSHESDPEINTVFVGVAINL